MEYRTIADPAEFKRRTRSLLADEARHNLIRGILWTLLDDRDVDEDYSLFVVDEDGESVAAALMTDPYSLILADAAAEAALTELVAGLISDSVPVPGAIGNRPTVDVFVEAWHKAAGETVTLGMEQGIFSLERLVPARRVAGAAHPAGPADAELVFQWMNEFIDEALPDEPRDDASLRRSIDRRLAGDGPGGVWVWDVEGRVTAMTSHGSPTGSGIRIGGVYTPPAERGNGFASALVAAQSGWLLNLGYDFCFLFTDLANPTSNAIYERIGYRQVAEGASYTFDSASPST
ncbi:MAG: GNAT family N-acetyltransferase [bacterium]|nr:GNAT family N-acetyltransferase [bacterium]